MLILFVTSCTLLAPRVGNLWYRTKPPSAKSMAVRLLAFAKPRSKSLIPRSLVASFRQITKESSSTMNTADLSDAYNDILQYVEPNLFKNYGGNVKFGGMISTVKCHEDNVLVKQALSEQGNKRVREMGGSVTNECHSIYFCSSNGVM